MARRAALDEIIGNRLIDDEAKARGIDRATLVEKEIADKAPAPTDADIDVLVPDTTRRGCRARRWSRCATPIRVAARPASGRTTARERSSRR